MHVPSPREPCEFSFSPKCHSSQLIRTLSSRQGKRLSQKCPARAELRFTGGKGWAQLWLQLCPASRPLVPVSPTPREGTGFNWECRFPEDFMECSGRRTGKKWRGGPFILMLQLFVKKEKKEKKRRRRSPGLCGSVGWALSHRLKGCQFNSPWGHVAGLWVRSPAKARMAGNQSVFLPPISVSLPLCLPLVLSL